MFDFDVSPGGVAIGRKKLIRPTGLVIPGPALEEVFPLIDPIFRKKIGDMLLRPVQERILMMSGSLCKFATDAAMNALFGGTTLTPAATLYAGLWAASLSDTMNGATGSEAAYGSYARLSQTNNTTIFGAATGTNTSDKSFPSDALKSFATSTATGTNNVIVALAYLTGNAGSSADKAYVQMSVTSTTINNGDTPQLAVGAVTGSLD